MRFFLEISWIFFLSFLSSFIILDFKPYTNQLQKIIGILLVILLIFLNRYVFSKSIPKNPKLIKIIFLYLSSLFVQILVFSTGGLSSPFLIILHLYTLGLSFLVSLRSAMTFLFLSILLLIASLWLDPTGQSLLYTDLGTLLLYGASFIVIIPLSILLSHYYHIKDTLLSILDQEVKVGKLREEVLLKGISELILITDPNFNIVSANETAERTLSLSRSELIYRPIFDVLFLKTSHGKLADVKSLQLDQIFSNPQNLSYSDLLILAKNNILPKRIDLQIRPITSLEGKIEQLVFVINYLDKSQTGVSHSGKLIEQAMIRHQGQLEQFKKTLVESVSVNYPQLRTTLELLSRTEEDLIITSELESSPVIPRLVPTDVATVCKKVVNNEKSFARFLNVNLNSLIVDTTGNNPNILIPQGYNISTSDLTAPFFTTAVDLKWVDVLVRKLLDLAILISSGTNYPVLNVTMDAPKDRDYIKLTIQTSQQIIEESQLNLIFAPYYGNLVNVANLKLSSGLEGYMAKKISELLDYSLNIKKSQTNGAVFFTLEIPKVKN